MQKLILDKSKWICGIPVDATSKPGITSLGKGSTRLLNAHGYMCCLGQFAKQLDINISDDMLLNKWRPQDIMDNIPHLVKYHKDSKLSLYAVEINDDTKITIEEKIIQLKELFLKYDIQIEVIN